MPEVTGDTAEATSTALTPEQAASAFAELRKQTETEAPVAVAEEAAPTTSEPEVESEIDVPEVKTEAPVKVKFKIGDEELDEDEIIEARKSGLRQADYTKKTQEVSKKAQELEKERASERAETLAKWQALEDAVASVTPKAPDFVALQAQVRAGAISEADYNRIAADWVTTSQQMDAIKAERQKAEDAVKADKAKESEATAKRNFERVLELIPDWKDVSVRQKDFVEMTAYVQELGESEQVLANLPPSAFKMLKDAVAYHKLQQNTAKPKVVKVDGVTLKPGSPQSSVPKTSEVESTLRRVAQTHHDDDAVAGFRALRKAGLY